MLLLWHWKHAQIKHVGIHKHFHMYKTRISINALTENVIKDILLCQNNRMPVVTTFGAGLTQGLSIFHRAAISVLAGSKVYAFPPALPVCSVELPHSHCPHDRQVWSWGKQVWEDTPFPGSLLTASSPVLPTQQTPSLLQPNTGPPLRSLMSPYLRAGKWGQSAPLAT